MDSRGNVYTPEQVKAIEESVKAGSLADARTVKTLVELPDKETAEALQALPRAKRRAWYSDYRRALKRARKTGKPVDVPPVPTL